jgi:error-prone DNA polymerase
LRIRPIDIQVSNWECTIEHDEDALSLRLGLGYAKGLRAQSGKEIVAAKQDGLFESIEDLVARVPSLNRKDLTLLASVGALNSIGGISHRRDALWQAERAGKLEGPLFSHSYDSLREESTASPLHQMSTQERLVADYAGTGLTVGRHPMSYCRKEFRQDGVLCASELAERQDGGFVKAAGCVIARQRPGTAKGFIFISMEDETGIANVIVTPDLYERERLVVTRSKFLLVYGRLQNQDGVVHVKATQLRPLSGMTLEVRSHDFH